ncbi:MAG: hypothetical protein ACOZBL_05465 [Patescibacteria group bacterium]
MNFHVVCLSDSIKILNVVFFSSYNCPVSKLMQVFSISIASGRLTFHSGQVSICLNELFMDSLSFHQASSLNISAFLLS